MKIILRADVENLGRLGDVVTVKAGYGRNYLLPQGLAMLVTPGNIKAFELERKKLQARMDALRAAADELAGKLGETFPDRLSLPQQGAFQLGYYHQTQARYTKKEEAEHV